MILGCAQTSPVLGDPEHNLEHVLAVVRQSRCDVIVFPELALSGYAFSTTAEAFPYAESLDGPRVTLLRETARETQTAIAIGILERSGDRLFNSAIAIDFKGNIAGHYRKVHRFYYETEVFERGDLGFPVFDLATKAGSVTCGLLICYDWRFPEAARSLALQGAEIIFMPSNIVTTTGMLHTTLQTRAFENKVILAFADRVGTEPLLDEMLQFRGESAVVNYNGDILAKAGASSEEVVFADVDPAKTVEKRINRFNDVLKDRFPESYR